MPAHSSLINLTQRSVGFLTKTDGPPTIEFMMTVTYGFPRGLFISSALLSSTFKLFKSPLVLCSKGQSHRGTAVTCPRDPAPLVPRYRTAIAPLSHVVANISGLTAPQYLRLGFGETMLNRRWQWIDSDRLIWKVDVLNHQSCREAGYALLHNGKFLYN